AERLEQPSPTTYVVTLRRGVHFHDGHELTADDVVYTFESLKDPNFLSPRRGGFRELEHVEARDRYTVVFTLNRRFTSLPINRRMPIVPAGATRALADHPVGTGPYRFVRNLTDDRIELQSFDGYFAGTPKNDGLVLKVVPDDVMRGLELRKGTTDV